MFFKNSYHCLLHTLTDDALFIWKTFQTPGTVYIPGSSARQENQVSTLVAILKVTGIGNRLGVVRRVEALGV